MAKEPRPARLMPPTAMPAAKAKLPEFYPEISNHPDLPAIEWTLIGATAPGLPATPATDLPPADAVVITWAEPEWAALQQVFCQSGTAMPYGSRNQGTWPGWQKYDKNMPADAGSDWSYWGYYRLVTVGAKKVLLFKSNTHYAASNGEANLSQLISRIQTAVAPSLILSIGTAGGTIPTDHVGTVNVVHAGTLYKAGMQPADWNTYMNAWLAGWGIINKPAFAQMLFPVPTTAADLAAILSQFNAFYNTSYALSVVNIGDLDMADPLPRLSNMTGATTPLITAAGFVVGTSDGKLASFACVEMDDAIIAKACQGSATQFGFVRNISDPAQNAAIPNTKQHPDQGNWGSAIYHAYGFYTSYNGALAAWAILSA